MSATNSAAVRAACERIMPTWPLDRFIAVNPFWSLVDRPLPAVATELASFSGSRLVMPRAWFRSEWRAGRLTRKDLELAVAATKTERTVGELAALLESTEESPAPAMRSRVMDVLDEGRDLAHGMSWRELVIERTSQVCASYFDAGQATMQPPTARGLYAFWRSFAQSDAALFLLMNLGAYGAIARELPERRDAMIELALTTLAIPFDQQREYLCCLLLDMNGWASWTAYRRWTARLRGSDDDEIVELLAVRLAWEWILHRSGGPDVRARWSRAIASWPATDRAARDVYPEDWVYQRAVEIAYHDDVARRLSAAHDAPAPPTPDVQAAFCIDVRSEVVRRALERECPRIQTLGFAGFFGLPIEFVPLGADAGRPQLPGLLAPTMRVVEEGLGDAASRAEAERETGAIWRRMATDPISIFSFVESAGVLAAGKLLGETFARYRPSTGIASAHKVELTSSVDGANVSLATRCELATGMLRGMSLTRGFARLVMFVGHGASTRNNPYAAGLACGACSGQSGEVNARVAAKLLNDAEVRADLARGGIVIPETTCFVAALHETVSDDIIVLDRDEVPASHFADLSRLETAFARASIGVRREKATSFGLSHLDDDAIERAARRRSRDWAEVRPEWGLANNASFIAAPRARTQSLDLGGRAFLHDYNWKDDDDFLVLEQIMTAPMVVAHWINLQYYASTVDNERYGTGDKVLHNVVGGHLGVFEGNGGDLRIGLALQSLHDGERWVHTPLRLSVFIEAPRHAIERVLAKHEQVRALVENEWVFLFRIDAKRVESWRKDGWGAHADGSDPPSFRAPASP